MKTPKELQIIAPSIMSRIMTDVADNVEGFREISKSKYFLKKLSLMDPHAKKTSLALTIVYLQDHENNRELMQDEVVEAIRNSIEENNLSEIVKDFVVNLTHIHDDTITV